jgi:hypothetical protein
MIEEKGSAERLKRLQRMHGKLGGRLIRESEQ